LGVIIPKYDNLVQPFTLGTKFLFPYVIVVIGTVFVGRKKIKIKILIDIATSAR
jgi:hypothetical protein